MRQRLWGTETFVDFDHGLNTAVNKIREALGDSASVPRYVETVSGKGYRFLAPVTLQEQAAAVLRSDRQTRQPRTGDPGPRSGIIGGNVSYRRRTSFPQLRGCWCGLCCC